MGDYVGDQLQNKKTGAFLDFITAGVGFIWVVAGFIGGIKVVANLLTFTYEHALVLTILLIGSYILISGYRVVLATDVVQMLVIIGLLVIVFGTLFTSVDVSTVSTTSVESLPIVLIIGIAIFGFFTIFGTADRYQLIYSAKSEKAAKTGLLWSVVPFSLAFLPLVFIGLFMRTQGTNLDPDTVFLTFINTFTSASVASIAGVMLVAGLMSTADTWVYATASHFQTARKKWAGKIETISVSSLRSSIVVCLVFMGIVSFFFRDLLEIAIFSAALLVALSIPMLYVISNGDSSERFVLAVVISIGAVIVGTVLLGVIPEILLFPIAAGSLSLLIPVKALLFIKRLFTVRTFR
ncbi:MAG: Na+/proline symporter [Candidatus Paceibacteria bacterium]|jgi:Na+/proline symporter